LPPKLEKTDICFDNIVKMKEELKTILNEKFIPENFYKIIKMVKVM